MALNIDLNSINPALIEKAERAINEEYNQLNFTTSSQGNTQFDHLTRTLLKVHAMLVEMRQHSPMAYISLISNMRCTTDVANFNYDPLQPGSMVVDYDFMQAKDLLDTDGDFVLDTNNALIKGIYEFKHKNLLEDEKIIRDLGLPDDIVINFWQKMPLVDVFKYRGIPFISYATVEDEPDQIYLNIIPKLHWEKRRKDFQDAVKDIVGYQYEDAYIDHVYTNDKNFQQVANHFGLRNYYVNTTYHFNKLHPWLFDIYCMVSKKNGKSDTVLNPLYYIRDYMRKSSKIIMPIDTYLLGDTNIDGQPLCKKINGVGTSTATYTKCNRLQCTCYNPFRGRDFRSVLTKAFYKHLSVTEYRDTNGDIRVGYVFSKDSNPNCVNCRGAKGVCPCNDNYRTALMLRDCPSITAQTVIYVMGHKRQNYSCQYYNVQYLSNLDDYKPYGTAIPLFFVPDGKTLWDYEAKNDYVKIFKQSIKVYSLSKTMMQSICSDPEEDFITAIITPINLFTDDTKPFKREENIDQTDEIHCKFKEQLKIMQQVKQKQKRDAMALLKKKTYKAEKVKSRVKRVRLEDGSIGISYNNKKAKIMGDAAEREFNKWKKKHVAEALEIQSCVKKKKTIVTAPIKEPLYEPHSPTYDPGGQDSMLNCQSVSP